LSPRCNLRLMASVLYAPFFHRLTNYLASTFSFRISAFGRIRTFTHGHLGKRAPSTVRLVLGFASLWRSRSVPVGTLLTTTSSRRAGYLTPIHRGRGHTRMFLLVACGLRWQRDSAYLVSTTTVQRRLVCGEPKLHTVWSFLLGLPVPDGLLKSGTVRTISDCFYIITGLHGLVKLVYVVVFGIICSKFLG